MKTQLKRIPVGWSPEPDEVDPWDVALAECNTLEEVQALARREGIKTALAKHGSHNQKDHGNRGGTSIDDFAGEGWHGDLAVEIRDGYMPTKLPPPPDVWYRAVPTGVDPLGSRLLHFGDEATARDAGEARSPGDFEVHSFKDLNMSLYPKVMHDDEVRAISSALYGKPDVDALWTPEVKEFLGSSSYDAVLYLNNAEGPGKHLSLAWIRNRFAKHGVVAKHTPGGQSHDQSTHGRRGGASRPPSTPSSTPSTPYRNSNFLDTLTEADPATFYAGFAQARAGKFGAYLSPFTEADFAQPNISAFVAFDGLVGGVLTDHGDGRIEVGSLFSLPGAPSGAGIDMLRYLIREKGANWLNNFDGQLTDLYKAEGFVEESRDSWNDEYAPSGWNYELFGRPDYVTMGLPNRIAKALLRALKWN